MNEKRFDVVMLATVHDATDDRVFYREAKTLREAGLSVCIIAPHSSSACLDGVWIDALPRRQNHFRRLLQGWTVLRQALRLDGSVFIFHDSELFPVALILRLLRRRVVYDCHENLPMQVLQKKWIPRPLRWLMVPAVWLMEWAGSRLLSGVLVARDSVLSRFPSNRRVSIRNFPTAMALSTSQGPPIATRSNVVIYAGGLSRIRGIAELVEAIRQIVVPQAELWLVGAFDSEEFQDEILSSLPPNAKWFGKLEHSEVTKLYSSAKIGMSTLHPTPSHRNSQPVKIYEYMGAGLPVIASNFPEFSELLDRCGVLVDPLNPKEISAAIRELLSDEARLEQMSQVARSRVLTSYTWDHEGQRLIQFCSKLMLDQRWDATECRFT
jgi:glycosyltransferase involved in cell wall biosynthesis